MFRMPTSGKLVLAALAMSASLAAVQPASARPYHWGPHPGWGRHHVWRAPIARGPRCVAHRVWVRTPFGPRPVLRRFCRW
jgi:hypothetical protein